MLEMLRERIADKSFMRLVAKCMHVGVLDGERYFRPEEGTVQGSIISPMLGNIYLHNELDKWFEEEVRPRMKMYWRRNRGNVGWHLAWKTRKARLGRAIGGARDQCRRQRFWPIPEQHKALERRIRGHFNYFGINDNTKSLELLINEVERAWYKWLNRRSQRSRLNWKRFKDLLRDFPLPIPRVYADLWCTS